MSNKLINQWKRGTLRDEENKVHNALIEYADLSDSDKDKDRDSVRQFPDIAKDAGFVISDQPHA